MERKRDESIERLLRGALKVPAGADLSRECLDAETLAARTDGRLSGTDRAMADAHLSACPRCQAMLAIMVRTAPLEPVPDSWWQRTRGLGWLVPLTAGTAAIVLWFAVQNGQRPTMVQQPAAPNFGTEEAQQERAQAEVAPVAPKPQESVTLGDRTKPGTVVGRERDVAPGAEGRTGPTEERANASSERVGQRQDRGEARKDETAPAQAAAAADRLGKVAEAASSAAPRAAAAPPSAASRALEAAAARASNEAVTLSRQGRGESTDIVSPDPAIRWRVGPSGSIQYSINGGSAWEALSSGATADLIVGVSPSTTVCWVVGRSGAVLLTIDGRRFQRLPFPESVDLVAVQATDARAATVTAADGRIFRTTDGGQTWVQTRLQEF